MSGQLPPYSLSFPCSQDVTHAQISANSSTQLPEQSNRTPAQLRPFSESLLQGNIEQPNYSSLGAENVYPQQPQLPNADPRSSFPNASTEFPLNPMPPTSVPCAPIPALSSISRRNLPNGVALQVPFRSPCRATVAAISTRASIDTLSERRVQAGISAAPPTSQNVAISRRPPARGGPSPSPSPRQPPTQAVRTTRRAQTRSNGANESENTTPFVVLDREGVLAITSAIDRQTTIVEQFVASTSRMEKFMEKQTAFLEEMRDLQKERLYVPLIENDDMVDQIALLKGISNVERFFKGASALGIYHIACIYPCPESRRFLCHVIVDALKTDIENTKLHDASAEDFVNNSFALLSGRKIVAVGNRDELEIAKKRSAIHLDLVSVRKKIWRTTHLFDDELTKRLTDGFCSKLPYVEGYIAGKSTKCQPQVFRSYCFKLLVIADEYKGRLARFFC